MKRLLLVDGKRRFGMRGTELRANSILNASTADLRLKVSGLAQSRQLEIHSAVMLFELQYLGLTREIDTLWHMAGKNKVYAIICQFFTEC